MRSYLLNIQFVVTPGRKKVVFKYLIISPKHFLLLILFQEPVIDEEISYNRNENIAVYLGEDGSFDLQDFNKVSNGETTTRRVIICTQYYIIARFVEENGKIVNCVVTVCKNYC